MDIFLTVLKAVACLIGSLLIAVYFIQGVLGDKAKLKKAGLVLGGIFLILTLLTVIEFVIVFSKR